MAERAIEGGFGIYVHWPFCAAKCPYCDFNSHVRKSVDEKAWAAAYALELRHWAERMGDERLRVDSVFFGGGTPSLMAPQTVETVLDAIAEHFALAPDSETTLEANPASSDAARFAGFRAAGINRLSLGVQSLIDSELKALGRWHTAEEALAAFELAREIFPRTSFDLIAARPDQTPQSWRDELNAALARAPSHLSIYHLTIEDGTPFAAAAKKGTLRVPGEDIAAAIYETTQDLCAAAGLPAYEISNHAKPRDESRHNLVYWRYGEYLGVGPGAHGRITVNGEKRATSTVKKPEDWLASVMATGHGLERDESVSAPEQADEFLLMGLRLSEGIDPSRYERLAGKRISQSALERLGESGAVARLNGRIAATPKGRLVLNSLIAELSA